MLVWQCIAIRSNRAFMTCLVVLQNDCWSCWSGGATNVRHALQLIDLISFSVVAPHPWAAIVPVSRRPRR